MKVILTARIPGMDEQERHIAEWWVLLWSQRQNCFHIERVRHMLAANRRAYAEDRSMDYAPVFIGTDQACHMLADTLRGTITRREEDRLGRGDSGAADSSCAPSLR